MVRVFEIRFDLAHFQALLVDGDDDFSFPFFDVMDFRSGPVAEAWKPPPLYVDQPTLKRPDVFHLVGAVGLVFTPRALDQLENLLLRSGEVLPLPFADEDFHLLNVGIIDCLDEARSAFDGAGVATTLEFQARQLPETPIFRIPQNQSSQLFCHDGFAQPASDFRATVKDAALTGWVFDEVWNSDSGGIPRQVKW